MRPITRWPLRQRLCVVGGVTGEPGHMVTALGSWCGRRLVVHTCGVFLCLVSVMFTLHHWPIFLGHMRGGVAHLYCHL